MQVVRLVRIRLTPHLPQDRLVGEQLALVAGEQPQQVVLVGRQLNRRAPDRDLARFEVEPQLSDLEDGLR